MCSEKGYRVERIALLKYSTYVEERVNNPSCSHGERVFISKKFFFFGKKKMLQPSQLRQAVRHSAKEKI